MKKIDFSETYEASADKKSEIAIDKVNEIIDVINSKPKPILVVRFPRMSDENLKIMKEHLEMSIPNEEYHKIMVSSSKYDKEGEAIFELLTVDKASPKSFEEIEALVRESLTKIK